MHKVSIILPSYNHRPFLKERLKSIVNQTFKDWKLIIIDDCSSDGSIEVLKDFKEKYIDKIEEFIVNKKNSGSGYKSWEKGIEIAKSKYIWIAETDDYSDSFFLENLVESLDNNINTSLCFCTSVYVDNKKNILYTSEKRTKDLEVPKNKIKNINSDRFIDKIPFNTYITNGSSVVFRNPKNKLPKELFSSKQLSDLFLWTYLLKNNSEFVFVNKPLNYFRRHEGATTLNNTRNNLKMVYQEKIDFLNFFHLDNKKKEFIQHYIKYYVWKNKKEWNKIKLLSNFDNNKNLILFYYGYLINFCFLKLKEKWS